MENKLIPLSDFVQKQLDTKQSTSEFKETVRNYTEFLKQPLTLGMFIPVDENNVPLEFIEYEAWTGSDEEYNEYTHKYFEATNKVLFEGFYYQSNYSEKTQTKYEYVRNKFPHVFSFEQIKNNTIESLLTGFKEEFQITLTATAIKSIYGS
ncbi:hypothetical protein [Elizabethkingia meningoseptica]|uniref:hypothetical protein n=1 Tax=Elizabethkingia meningoseptica TaxID=238 RepID=UPI0038925279